VARIVVVEDEIQVLMLAESVLQQAGHDTVCASTVGNERPRRVSRPSSPRRA
jgi:CheY-like chemotaxis protein